MPISYKIDKTTSELWIIDDSFVTRLSQFVCLSVPGRYLFYDSNVAIDVITDFRSRLTIIGEYPTGSSAFFKTSTIHFDTAGIIVFDLPSNHDSVTERVDIETKPKPTRGRVRDLFNTPLKKSSSSRCTFSKSDGSFGSIDDDRGLKGTYIFTRSVPPRMITPGPMGYIVGGYNLHVIKAANGQPTSYIVYDVSGNETQEPMVKMNIYRLLI
jgi:hypothetical protein